MIITLDFETYYSDDYTLKKMTTEAYVRDPRFEALLVGVKQDDQPAEWMTIEAFSVAAWTIPRDAVFLCHHAQFDGLILSHHFGIKPKRWLCTLSMARYLHGQTDSLSLASLAVKYGLREKTIDYDSFKGRRLVDMDHSALDQLGVGCARDCDSTYNLFVALARGFPLVEYRAIDTTIRMFTEPKLVGDATLFADIRDREFQSKNERLYALGVGESDLQSAVKFTALLEAEGVDMEWKEGTSGPIPAIAKTDDFMRRLCEDDNERVAALANARLEVRSTIAETRAGRLYDMAKRGGLPVYLHYCGAHTRRWSGGDAVNFQNLGRGSDLRRGVRAPEGCLIAAPDQSQGECRILNWLAGQEDVLQRFRMGHDPYLPIASKFYGRELTAADAVERQFGKVLELQAGFGAGALSIQRSGARAKIPVILSDSQSEDAKNLYRSEHQNVVQLWKEGEWVIQNLYRTPSTFDWRIFHGENGKLYHPNGSWMDYTRLQWDVDAKEWRLHGRRGWSKMYGAKLVENVVQWLSRIVTVEAMARFEDAGYPIVGMAHDDVWLLVDRVKTYDIPLEAIKRQITDIMAADVSWAPGLPLDADCKIGETYS